MCIYLKIAGTRVTNTTPVCEAPTTCSRKCEDIVQCPYGQKLDEKGCPTCDCKDPCEEARCRPDETCELVPLECEVRTGYNLSKHIFFQGVRIYYFMRIEYLK